MSFTVGEIPYPQDVAALIRNLPTNYLRIELADLGALHVVGSPGEGKSTFLGRLADACITEGEGVLLIDPKGDLAVDVASRTAHPDKLIYIAPGERPDLTFAFNVLEIPGNHPDKETYRDIVGGNLLKMFEHMGRFDPVFMAMIATYLSISVKTAYTRPHPTIIDVIGVLISKVERDALTKETRRPEIKMFWNYFNERSNPEQRNQIDSTLRRLWDFLLDTKTFRFVDHAFSKIQLGDWLNDGKLIVVNLAQGLNENDAERMGNLMVAYLATQYRLRASGLVPWDRSRRWRLIVDEFHNFSPAPYAQIIREGRAFNFYPVMAHQDMGQLKGLGHIETALGHVAKLQFRRSAGDVPVGSYEAQQQFVDAQREMKKHEADWIFRGPTGTTSERLKMPNWEAVGKENQLTDAKAQAIQFTLPQSQFPSSHNRLEAWGLHDTMESNAKPTSKSKRQTKAPGTDKPFESQADLSVRTDSARPGSDAVDLETGLFDLVSAGKPAVLGGTSSQDPVPPQPVVRPKSSQRNVPIPPQGPRVSRSDPSSLLPEPAPPAPPRVQSPNKKGC